jgi:Fur family ferric uptake transcriptional regulator
MLSQNGEIQKLELGGSLKRFDGIAANHHHIRCIHCHRVVDAPKDFDVTINLDLKDATDFKILGHRLELTGICPDCLN